MKRIFLREEERDVYRKDKNNVKIGVVGLVPGAGASTIGTAIAKELSKNKMKRVVYVEINKQQNKPFLYDSLGMDKRFAGREYFDFFSAVGNGINVSEKINLDERINWVLPIPANAQGEEKLKSLNVIQLCRLVNHVCGDIIICDICWDDKTDELLQEMDYILAVLDPLPSKLIFGYERLCSLKKRELQGRKTIWVVNKYNEGINKKDFKDFTKLKKEICVPCVPQEYLYNAEYNCKIAYTSVKVYESLKEPIQEIVSRIVV